MMFASGDDAHPIDEYSIWLLPESEQQCDLVELVDSLAARFGTETFTPHITIQGDLTLQLEQLSGAIAAISKSYGAQQWPVASIEGGDHFFRSLFLRFDEQPAYIDLKRDMQHISGTTEGLSLFPHLSIAYGLDAKHKTPEIFRELGTATPQVLRLDRIAIARSSKNVPIANWECLAEFTLR